MTSNAPLVHRQTPSVSAFARKLKVREIACHRDALALGQTTLLITRHRYDPRGFLDRSVDPRMAGRGLVNFALGNDFTGKVLRVQSVDAGIEVALADIDGRPLVHVSAIAAGAEGRDDYSQAVVRRSMYEAHGLAGRLSSISDTVGGGVPRMTQRFVYGGSSALERGRNLAGRCTRLYDTAGLALHDAIAMTGTTLSVTRRLLGQGDEVQTVVDWQGESIDEWDRALETTAQAHTTCSVVDATGTVSSIVDAAGNRRRVTYDIAGRLQASWLRRKDSQECEIVRSTSYLAGGHKTRELQGNGVSSTYFFEPRTQRQVQLRIERPASHALGARLLQDLQYSFDPVGNVVSERDEADNRRFWRNQVAEPQTTYCYDSLYQLVGACGREQVNASSRAGEYNTPSPSPYDETLVTRYTRNYIYDTAGNLTRMVHRVPASNHCRVVEITVSDRSNRAVLGIMAKTPAEVEALFTAKGQQISLLPGNPLCWTSQGELHQVISQQREEGRHDHEHYRYDSASMRVLKVNTQWSAASQHTLRVTYLPGLELRCTTRDASLEEELQVISVGEPGHAQVRMLHWCSEVPDGLENDQLRYSYDTSLGSGILEVDGAGRLISHEAYYPFGGTALWAARSELEGSYKTLRYSGKERDATGLYYYGYRYYQPWVGRWLSADPAGAVEGLNLYCMVRNNPVTRRDANGLHSFETEFGSDFAALDKLIEFPEIFKNLKPGVVLKGNVSQDTQRRKKLTVYWMRESEAYQPTELERVIGPSGNSEQEALGPASQLAQDLGVTEQFAKDFTRDTYTLIENGEETPLFVHNVEKYFSSQQLEIISMLAHQALAAEITSLLYSIEPAGGAFNEQGQVRGIWSAAPGAASEYQIHRGARGEPDEVSISSRQVFSLKDVATGEFIAKVDAITQHTVFLATSIENGEVNYNLQKHVPSLQKITLLHVLPEQPVPKKSPVLSRFKFWKSNKQQ